MKVYEEIEKMTYQIQKALINAEMTILMAELYQQRGNWDAITEECRLLIREAGHACAYLDRMAADMREDDPQNDNLCPFCHQPVDAAENGQGTAKPDHAKCGEN